ncbi:hypothetical protein B0O99DRAFT_73682 [Bisporella sp. PMI_857]|nr:hypothetical protein B0O99DRAFT_73682 [Bisporella sp. PMI_857]
MLTYRHLELLCISVSFIKSTKQRKNSNSNLYRIFTSITTNLSWKQSSTFSVYLSARLRKEVEQYDLLFLFLASAYTNDPCFPKIKRSMDDVTYKTAGVSLCEEVEAS